MPVEDVDFLLDNSEHDSYIVNADSSLRDKRVYPSSSEFTINFDTPFNYVFGVDILDVSMPSSMWNIENINNSMKYHMIWYNPNFTAHEVNDELFYSIFFREIKGHPVLSPFFDKNENNRLLFVDEKDARESEEVQNILESTQEQNVLAIRHVLPHILLQQIDEINPHDSTTFVFFRIRKRIFKLSQRYSQMLNALKSWNPIVQKINLRDRSYNFVFKNNLYSIPIKQDKTMTQQIQNKIDIFVLEYAYLYENTNDNPTNTVPLYKWKGSQLKKNAMLLLNTSQRLFRLKSNFYMHKRNNKDKTIIDALFDEVAYRKDTKVISLFLFLDETKKENWEYRVDFDQSALNTRDVILPLNWPLIKKTTKINDENGWIQELPLYQFDPQILNCLHFNSENKQLGLNLTLPLHKYNASFHLTDIDSPLLLTPREFLLNNPFHLNLKDSVFVYSGDLYFWKEDGFNEQPEYIQRFIRTTLLPQDLKHYNDSSLYIIPAFLKHFLDENEINRLKICFKAPMSLNMDKTFFKSIQVPLLNTTSSYFQKIIEIYHSRLELPKSLTLEFKNITQFTNNNDNNDNNDKHLHFILQMPFLSMSEKDVVITRHGYNSHLYKLGDTLYSWHENAYKDELSYPKEIRNVVQQALHFHKIESLTVDVVIKSKSNDTYVYQFTMNTNTYTFYSTLVFEQLSIYVYPEHLLTLVITSPFYLLNDTNDLSFFNGYFDHEHFYVIHTQSIFIICAYDLRVIDGTLDNDIIWVEDDVGNEAQKNQKKDNENKEGEKYLLKLLNRILGHYIFSFTPEKKESEIIVPLDTLAEHHVTFENINDMKMTYKLPYTYFINNLTISPLNAYEERPDLKDSQSSDIETGMPISTSIPLFFFKAQNENPKSPILPYLPHDQTRFYEYNDNIYYNPSFHELRSHEQHLYDFDGKEKEIYKRKRLISEAIKENTIYKEGETLEINIEKDQEKGFGFYKHRLNFHNDMSQQFNFRFGVQLHVTDDIVVSPNVVKIDNIPLRSAVFYTYRYISHIELGNLFRRDSNNNLPTLPWCPFILFNGYFELEPGNYNLFEFINELNNNFKSSRSFRGQAGVEYDFPFNGNNVIHVVKANDNGEITKTGKIRFEIPVNYISFIFNLRESKMRDTIGFSSNVRTNILDFNYIIHPYYDNRDLVRSLPRTNNVNKQVILPPGVVYLLGIRYVVLRCPEIESLIGTHAYGKHSPGIGIFILGLNQQLVKQRLDFVHYVRKPFHPIEKLNRLTFRFELQDGSLYDFKGVDMFMILQIKTYIPKKRHPFDYKKSRLNPNYNPDFIQYTIDEEQKRMAQKHFTQNKQENHFAYDSDDAQEIVHLQNQYEDDDEEDENEDEDGDEDEDEDYENEDENEVSVNDIVL
jgi:hypothetical protein